MATIIDLPVEVITIILENKNISVEDILSFESTCNRLQQITFSTKFWEKKFYQRFSSSKKNYEKNTKKLKNIFNHAETSTECIKRLEYYVSLMPYNNLCDIQEEFIRFLCFISKHSMICCFVLDDISRIMSTPRHDSNLTTKYNFGLIFQWIRQYRLINEQNEFINLSKEKLLLERQIAIIIQYFLPCVSYSDIDAWLDNITQEVLCRLKNKHPTHSVFSISSEKFIVWRYNNIDDNFWNPREGRQIIRILEEYIFSELEFQKLFELFTTLDVDSKYINYVLTHYRECILPIIHHSVARRLGIRCFLHRRFGSDDSAKYILEILWGPKYNTEKQRIDCLYMKKSNLQYPANIGRDEHLIHYVDLLQNPVHDILEVLETFNCKLSDLSDLNDHFNIFYSWKLNNMRKVLLQNLYTLNIEQRDEYSIIARSIKDRIKIVRKKRPERRNKKIKFAIGIVVRIHRHLAKRLGFLLREIDSHTGVIIGWHYTCKASFLKKNFDSFVPHLSECGHRDNNREHYCICRCEKNYYNIHKRIQFEPHYIILAGNNMLYYLPQDTLSICSPRWIDNVEKGRYFSKFEGTHYIPNESLAKQYPTDIAAIHEILSSVF